MMLMRLLLIAMGLGCGAHALFAKEQGTILEVAPLQGVLGQISARGEGAWKDSVAWGLQVENRQTPSERSNCRDSWRRASLEAVQYPRLWQLDGLFLAAGLDYEFAQIARQRDRDYVTTIRYTEDERYDLWVNEDHNFLAHAGAGYRFFLGKRATASLRYMHSTLLYTHGEVKRETIYSSDPDLSSQGRPRQEGRIPLFMGVSLD